MRCFVRELFFLFFLPFFGAYWDSWLWVLSLANRARVSGVHNRLETKEERKKDGRMDGRKGKRKRNDGTT